MISFRLTAVASVLTLLLTSAALAGGRRAGITIHNFAFGPRVLRIHPGTTVLVVNHDPTNHSFTSVSGRFELSRLRPGGGSGRVRFSHAGTYHYYCAFHSFMRGTIVVR